MNLYPAIDLLGGRCVRLRRGDYSLATEYEVDPVDQARRFEADGAPWIHVVDLDAARSGEPANREVIAAVAGAVEVPVQVGGGVRSLDDARELWHGGVARVVFGTAAVEHPELVEEAVADPGGQVAVGLDARGGELAVRGWEQGSGVGLLDAAGRYGAMGVDALVVTAIERDGTLEGPDLDALAEVVAAANAPVVASGGVGSVEHLLALTALDLDGVVVGRALYEGAVSVPEALAALT